jgi:hypothetical protein
MSNTIDINNQIGEIEKQIADILTRLGKLEDDMKKVKTNNQDIDSV